MKLGFFDVDVNLQHINKKTWKKVDYKEKTQFF